MKGWFMTIYNELFKVRKDFQTVKRRLNELHEQGQKRGSQQIEREIQELTCQLENLKVRISILEKLTGDYTH